MHSHLNRYCIMHKIFTIIFIFLSIPLFSQDGIFSGNEELERLFIEAEKLKLIGKNDQAIKVYKELSKKDPKISAVHYELARLYEEEESYEKSENAITRAVSLEPSNKWYRLFQAELYKEQSKFNQAIQVYEALIKQDPKNQDFLMSLASVYGKTDDYQKIIDVYNKLEKQAGIREAFTRVKFTAYNEMGKENKAAEEMIKLVNAYPNDLTFKHNLASFYKQIDQQEKANVIYKEILKVNPEDSKANIAIASALKSSGKDGDYLNSIKAILSSPQIDLDMKIKELIPYIQKVADTGDPILANQLIDITKGLDEVHGADAKIYAVQGDLLKYTGQRQAAVDSYNKVLELDDTVFPVWEQLMTALNETKRYGQLAEKSLDAIDLFPNKASSYYYSAVALYHLGKKSEALDASREAKMVSAGDPNLLPKIYALQSVLAAENKDLDIASKLINAAKEISSTSEEVLYFNYLYASVVDKDIDATIDLIKTALTQNPDQGKLQFVRGQALLKKAPEDAINYFTQLGDAYNYSEDCQILELLGDAYAMSGSKEEAVKQWEKSLGLNAYNKSSLEKKIQTQSIK